ncbi:hypothetical protein R2F25_08635 [Streptomyces sp. UP1A-1]|nr:hypothetical protein [Streptomyces sp. UP1A-1]
MISTHLIDAKALRANDYVAFFEARATALEDLVFQAMGKRTPVVRDTDDEEGER